MSINGLEIIDELSILKSNLNGFPDLDTPKPPKPSPPKKDYLKPLLLVCAFAIIIGIICYIKKTNKRVNSRQVNLNDGVQNVHVEYHNVD